MERDLHTSPQETFYDDRDLYLPLLTTTTAEAAAEAPYQRVVDESEEAPKDERRVGKFTGNPWKALYFMGKTIVSGFDFPFQSSENTDLPSGNST